MLTPQGRILYDMFLCEGGGGILIDCQAAYAADIMKKLNMYKMRSKVVIEDVSDRYAVYYSSSAEVMAPDPRHRLLGGRAILPGILHQDLEGDEWIGYHMQRMMLLVPDADMDIMHGQTLPLDIGGDKLSGVSFTKGCYVGQEVTARMNWRAVRRKRLYCIDVMGAEVRHWSKGDALEVGGMKLGMLLGQVQNRILALLNSEDLISVMHGKEEDVISSNIGDINIVETKEINA
jgi:folate-binding protein YgfZ